MRNPGMGIVILLLALGSSIWAGDLTPVTERNAAKLPESLRTHLNTLREARAPSIVTQHLVLSAKGGYRSVGIAFSHEQWATVHQFQKNEHGIFVYWMALPFGAASSIEYRLVFDGLWTTDPANPLWRYDERSGIRLSVAELPGRSEKVYGIWHPGLNGKQALFYYEGSPGQRITVAGTFNSWDPYIHELQEVRAGVYELTLDLPAGTYYYVFVLGGRRINDPLNQEVAWDQAGRKVSVLTMRNP